MKRPPSATILRGIRWLMFRLRPNDHDPEFDHILSEINEHLLEDVPDDEPFRDEPTRPNRLRPQEKKPPVHEGKKKENA